MIGLEAAEKLLDFSTRIGAGQRAREQLEGAVALHNILEEKGVAYLADEVGMGKTYVALGAMALFRHFDPSFRILVVAPRENIQQKWIKELNGFVANNVRFADLRVKALDGRPVRAPIACANLLELLDEVAVDPNRDFFLRLSSFSLPLSRREADSEARRRLRDGLRRHLPWLRDDVLDLRGGADQFKDDFARALCCALPVFDLVIVDEGHNLKRGVEHGPARNRVLALAFGHPKGSERTRFPGYRARARRVLFLSATPTEESYRYLWNQLDVFGKTKGFDVLERRDADEAEQKEAARQFLIRRVTAIEVGGRRHTKNLYRREWRRGGVAVHDEPIRIEDPRQRLIVALVQKKVSELLDHERFGARFQIGMLSSFESFLQTARLARSEDGAGNFDDGEQAEDAAEREGIDVHDVNRITRSYREAFQSEMPHPKMEALVEILQNAWLRGEKHLVFVRRVASVKEIKRKLDERYDRWLIDRLRRELPEAVGDRFEQVVERYRRERRESLALERDVHAAPDPEEEDRGGADSFFAWYFRGEGPRGVVSGANVQRRFGQAGATYATFFEDNYVAALLGCAPGEVEERLAPALGVDRASLREGLRRRSARFLPASRKLQRGDRFEAVQASAIEWLAEQEGPLQHAARIAWHERFEVSRRLRPAPAAPEIGDWLGTRTFFTELRARPELRARLWPEPQCEDERKAFRERELRARMLSAGARLGHAFIDLYALTIQRLGSLDPRAQRAGDGEDDAEIGAISAYLDLLERQMKSGSDERGWVAFDELADLAAHFHLILDVNAPELVSKPLDEAASELGKLFGQQQPIGGMSGGVNRTLVRQFRLPGYPLVLITTDLLQEGEDLHTFCSAVHHYGIAWTPSSMEQRIGRIDRVRSATERRLGAHAGEPKGDALLQVYFPHLEDTIEVLQVDRVLERMNTFLRLMHEGLSTPGLDERKIDARREFARERRQVAQIREPLSSAFEVKKEHLRGEVEGLAVAPGDAGEARRRFLRLKGCRFANAAVEWEAEAPDGILLGTARLGVRQQPFTLLLGSHEDRLLVRCVSPIGRVDPEEKHREIVAGLWRRPVRLAAVPSGERGSYDLTVEDDVLLAADPASDAERVGLLIDRVVACADELEQQHVPGVDAPLGAFREDLLAERQRG